jgi:hypothetical protein
MAIDTNDKRAPMASAPMKYLADGSVDWQNHLPSEVKQTLALQTKLERLKMQFKDWVYPRRLGTLLSGR